MQRGICINCLKRGQMEMEGDKDEDWEQWVFLCVRVLIIWTSACLIRNSKTQERAEGETKGISICLLKLLLTEENFSQEISVIWPHGRTAVTSFASSNNSQAVDKVSTFGQSKFTKIFSGWPNDLRATFLLWQEWQVLDFSDDSNTSSSWTMGNVYAKWTSWPRFLTSVISTSKERISLCLNWHAEPRRLTQV